jgi:hypothetical protein
MSQPAQLNIVLALQGLTTAVNGLQQFVQQTQTSMSRVAQSANGMAQQLANFYATALGVGKLRQYLGEAEQAARAQAQLTLALKQTNQFTPAYRDELLAMAQALQNLTGVQDEVIVGVERLLVQAGIAPAQLREMTATVLDLAASFQLDPQTVARGIGQMLKGQSEAIRGLKVDLDGTVNAAQRMQRILAAATPYRGAAGASLDGATADVTRYRIALEDARKEVGKLEAAVAGPFLEGFGRGVKGAVEWLTALIGKINEAVPSLNGLGEAFGTAFPLLAIAGLAASLGITLKNFAGSLNGVSAALGVNKAALEGAGTALQTFAGRFLFVTTVITTGIELFRLGKAIWQWREANLAAADSQEKLNTQLAAFKKYLAENKGVMPDITQLTGGMLSATFIDLVSRPLFFVLISQWFTRKKIAPL